MAIISLTSIPPRFTGLGPVLEQLQRQTETIDEIRLYIPKRYRRFPDYDGGPPDVPKGINVVRVEDDLGPASKFLHAARDLEGEEVQILFCDDDRIYSRHWARGLLRAQRQRPRDCVACYGGHLHEIVPGTPAVGQGSRAVAGRHLPDPVFRMKRYAQRLKWWRPTPIGDKAQRRYVVRAGYADIAFGYAGVVIRPDFIGPNFAIPDDVWMVDDILLSGHLARRGIGIWLPRRIEHCARTKSEKIDPLRAASFEGDNRRASDRRAIDHFRETYGIWRDIPPSSRATVGEEPADAATSP
ncbi:glycosyltransferase [Allosediminivita pacifica]|uniref:Glycosyl transferase family 2 n=1 Tax=Allosediminivita pacifica TaxID=1267769 RepID=A0A2T6ASI7_9RHOB|nr:glycosyltransferase [Allosediminivita pacifica]PTX46706.1 hypothetical protein C8N44_11574 [Allosediminivita pacifica]GGB16205.1 hypothetical protein GCM10011324_28060 [Allosediminivita pacifica]